MKKICLAILMYFSLPLCGTFIVKRSDLNPYINDPTVIMITSPGRSGSSLLTEVIELCAPHRVVIKSHLLPPDKHFKGKIIFIFSNPDLAAESALHLTLHDATFGKQHFINVETADMKWLQKIKDTAKQTVKNNLLSYDALGATKQLYAWLFSKVKSCSLNQAQVLAVKFESLWEDKTIEALKDFLDVDVLILPPQNNRGYTKDRQSKLEVLIRKTYNLGTERAPRYQAYTNARYYWETAPSYQFFKITN